MLHSHVWIHTKGKGHRKGPTQSHRPTEQLAPGQRDRSQITVFDRAIPNGAAVAGRQILGMMTETFTQLLHCSGIARRLVLRLLAVALDNSSVNSPCTRFINTARLDFGAYEIATQ